MVAQHPGHRPRPVPATAATGDVSAISSGSSQQRAVQHVGKIHWIRDRDDAKIPGLWRMSPLLEIGPKEVREQMLLSLHEIRKDHKNFTSKLISCATYTIEQSHGGHTNTSGRMEISRCGRCR